MWENKTKLIVSHSKQKLVLHIQNVHLFPDYQDLKKMN